MKFIGIIPSRYESTRFPGKPLADINGKSMIRRVYEQAGEALENVFVATDDQRIADEVNRFGGRFVFTSKNHNSGTDRLAEAIQTIQENLKTNFDVVINIQGDEPFIQPSQITELMNCFKDNDVEIATLIRKITDNYDIYNPNKPKVIFDKSMNAIYFSRSPIPFIRNHEKSNWIKSFSFYRHIGMYGYKTNILLQLTKLGRSPLEIAESLEQNRWIENGYKIKLSETNYDSIGIDTPEDLQTVLAQIKKG